MWVVAWWGVLRKTIRIRGRLEKEKIRKSRKKSLTFDVKVNPCFRASSFATSGPPSTRTTNWSVYTSGESAAALTNTTLTNTKLTNHVHLPHRHSIVWSTNNKTQSLTWHLFPPSFRRSVSTIQKKQQRPNSHRRVLFSRYLYMIALSSARFFLYIF